MEQRNFKPFGSISSLTLGGGGIGNVWGETSRKEAIETVNLAYESGINHFDVAPMYGRGEAEKVIGMALKNKQLEDGYMKLNKMSNKARYIKCLSLIHISEPTRPY